jgi:hypothetical protein
MTDIRLQDLRRGGRVVGRLVTDSLDSRTKAEKSGHPARDRLGRKVDDLLLMRPELARSWDFRHQDEPAVQQPPRETAAEVIDRVRAQMQQRYADRRERACRRGDELRRLRAEGRYYELVGDELLTSLRPERVAPC